MMNETELAQILRSTYRRAPYREKATAVVLFGIRYAAELAPRSISVNNVARLSGIGDSYYTQIRHGMRLARHVELKQHEGERS